MSLTEDQKEILVSMGVALILIQNTERVIKLVMTFVLQKHQQLNLDVLQKQEKEERRKTLGYFIRELRKRVAVEPDFDITLDEFLKLRNQFIHGIVDVPGWNLNCDSGLASARSFLNKLIRKTEFVMNVFIGLARSWQEQIGMPDSFSDIKFFQEIDKQYKPLVDQIFAEKS